MGKCIPTEKVSSELRDRSQFSQAAKEMAWKKAGRVRGRDPARWRKDIVGNVLFKKHHNKQNLVTAYQYDHIKPRARGGLADAANC